MYLYLVCAVGDLWPSTVVEAKEKYPTMSKNYIPTNCQSETAKPSGCNDHYVAFHCQSTCGCGRILSRRPLLCYHKN